MDLYAVWLDMNVYLLIVVAFKCHLGMNSLFGVTESSFWLAKVALQENIRNTKVELIRWVVLEKRCLCSVVVLDFEVCEEDDGGVGGEEDEDVPSTVEVREPHTCPPGAKDSVIDPAGDGHAPKNNTSPAKRENPKICLSLKFQEEKGNCWHPKKHEYESIDDRLEESKTGADTCDCKAE